MYGGHEAITPATAINPAARSYVDYNDDDDNNGLQYSSSSSYSRSSSGTSSSTKSVGGGTWQQSALKMDLQDNEWHHFAVLVTPTHATFSHDGRFSAPVPLVRPVTDCEGGQVS